MKKLAVLMATLLLCVALVGCGGGGGGTPAPSAPEPAGPSEPVDQGPVATSIAGDWICVDAKITDAGEEISGEEYIEMLDMTFEELMTLTAFGDGSGHVAFMGDEADFKWEGDVEKGYKLGFADETGAIVEDFGTATFKDGALTVVVTDSYTADGEEVVTTMEFFMAFQGMKSSIIEGYELMGDNDLSIRMSNFMTEGRYIDVDGTLYGHSANDHFMKAKITVKDKVVTISDKKLFGDEMAVTYFCQDKDYIYGLLNADEDYADKGLIRINKGSDEIETLSTDKMDYFQLYGDKFYFTDENHRFCVMDKDLKNKTTIIDKDCYYAYVMNDEWVIYQDDADNESLHMYNMKTKKDAKINDEVSYCPIIAGEFVYYITPFESEDKDLDDKFKRVNLYSGVIEEAEGDYMDRFFIADNHITFALWGAPGVDIEEWDQVYKYGMGGSRDWLMYRGEDFYVIRYDGGFYRVFPANDLSRESRPLFNMADEEDE